MLKVKQIANDLMKLVSDRAPDQDLEDVLGAARSARELYSLRRRRDSLFDNTLFGEPSWDIMLDLYEADLMGKPISVTSACIAAAVPQTTALRWLNILIDRGHVERYPDPRDARRSFLRLTSTARTKLDMIFSG